MLKKGTIVVRAEYTDDMKQSKRRYSIEGEDEEEFTKLCITCNIDITDHPESHSQCAGCFQSSKYGASGMKKRINSIKRCKACDVDIFTRPNHHVLCYRCYKR